MSTPEQETPPLPVGITIDRGFALLRRHPRPLLLPQLVLNLVPLVFGLLLVLVGYLLIGHVATTTQLVRESTFLGDSTLVRKRVSDFTDGQVATIVVLAVIGGLVYLWFVIAATISVVRGADRALEGREHLPLRTALRDGLRETPRLFGLGIVFAVLVVVALVVLGLLVALVAQVAGALAILAGLAAFLFVVWAGTRLFLWPIVHLSEHTGLGSFRRSWRVSKGRFWPLFAVVVLVAVVVSIVSGVVSFLLQLLVGLVASLSDAVGIAVLIPYFLISAVIGVVFTAGYIAPIVVAYRTLSGRDTADLWEAAGSMGGTPAAAAPVESGVRRWDAAEAPIGGAPAADADDPSSSPAADAGGPSSSSATDAGAPSPSTGAGGLPAADEPSSAEQRWGRGSTDDPRT